VRLSLWYALRLVSRLSTPGSFDASVGWLGGSCVVDVVVRATSPGSTGTRWPAATPFSYKRPAAPSPSPRPPGRCRPFANPTVISGRGALPPAWLRSYFPET
jgi:hypothetical protein